MSAPGPARAGRPSPRALGAPAGRRNVPEAGRPAPGPPPDGRPLPAAAAGASGGPPGVRHFLRRGVPSSSGNAEPGRPLLAPGSGPGAAGTPAAQVIGFGEEDHSGSTFHSHVTSKAYTVTMIDVCPEHLAELAGALQGLAGVTWSWQIRVFCSMRFSSSSGQWLLKWQMFKKGEQ
ncbi:cyclin-dependent kinase inhibitor 1C-like [Lutra lutra]|uniref:cyclin-dependent kinase inhibitor 1C-like n=1 Tax=Lutra lutra TaxID=9657 RepID=UPI001FD0E5B1|nr:cyclin-dependent kinase inhibitor 1C-like [Lutra lutra]